jgi:hypothetical protein
MGHYYSMRESLMREERGVRARRKEKKGGSLRHESRDHKEEKSR